MKHILQIIMLLACFGIQAQKVNTDKEPENKHLKILSLSETVIINGNFKSLDRAVLIEISKLNIQTDKPYYLVKDNVSDYFLINLSNLKTEFERAFFYKNINKLNLFIQTEHGLPSNLAWIISESKDNSKTMILKLEEVIRDTKRTSSKMSLKDKTIWLTNN